MKKLLLLALAFGLTAAASPPDEVARLRDAALEDQVAWDIVEGLTTEIGPRLGGTSSEARARSWAVAKLKALGFSNVHIEEYRMPTWVRGSESAAIVAPFPQALAVTALGNSGSTGDAGITALVVRVDGLEGLREAEAATLKGKIVFVDHRMRPSQDGSSYAAIRPIRSDAPGIAAAKGAAAIVIRSIGTDHDRLPHAGNSSIPEGRAAIPAAALSVPDAENLERMIARKQPVVMRLVLTPRQIGEQVSGNVVAEVPGSDPQAGIILIGGHLDSWDLGTGAVDDAAGVAITAAAAKRVMDLPGRPRRTIRVVWWGAEEVGLRGAIAYFERHKGENVVLVGESDFGADRVWRFRSGLPQANQALTTSIAGALAPLGIFHDHGETSGGPDVGNWVQAGVAALDLNQDGTRYFDLHHTANDTLDKIDPEQLRQNVAAWTAALWLAANSKEPIGRAESR